MTRVDFYQLDPARHRYDQVVCQLCKKAYDNRQLTLLLTQGPQQSQQLDHKLWTFADDSFIPHDSDAMKARDSSPRSWYTTIPNRPVIASC